MIMHDLKAPLEIVIQLTRYAESEEDKLMMSINSSSVQMMNLLDVRRMEEARMQVDINKHQVYKTVERAVDLLKHTAGLKKSSLVM